MTTMPGRDVSQTLDAQRRVLAEKVVARHYELEPERWQAYSAIGREKCVRDAEYHLMYLSEAIGTSSPSLFLDYVAWLKILFAGLGFPDETVVSTLSHTCDVLRDALPPEMASIAGGYLETAIARVRGAPATAPSFIQPGSTLAVLAQRYLDSLLRGERHIASQIIVDAAERGTDIRDIYLYVFQRTQREIGRLWQANELSVAQEHYCTAATQLIMSQLYPYIFTTERVGRRLVATCVGGELHEIGARVVADLFEIEGWDTYYLGANTPTASILEVVEERQPDILAISATMTFHLPAVADLVDRVRTLDSTGGLRVMVGGYPFNCAPELWRRLGADAYAPDAQKAVAVADRLLRGATEQ